MKTTFPNNLGNYTGKRKPKPEPKPMTADERFALLRQTYELRHRNYRWKR